MKGKFESGKVVASKDLSGRLESDKSFLYFCLDSFRRHMEGDWGEVSDEDKKLNEQAVMNESQIVSKYSHRDDTDIFIVTESDRSITTLCFKDEY